ncbi:type IX secretion system membrane protein PorP/SprF [Fulvivirga sp. RKSG066]|uniref:PorP/SprF family type IX secretion system membrane protein n=1 Tax=Fulvivirga aurantia TaxID=2529383 RepID=UPI0012BD30B9|nr:type IX secretion system membrane protein PorP/SprF [Fulvivirga aurantia]MTI20633.1 type IX secretion system membrane protein PorP/SprF [Fulvivirga aurantia]
MKAIKTILLFMLIAAAFESAGQQLSQLTMYNRSLILYNPAFTGSDDALSLTLFHRSQWAGLEGAPSTQALLAHTPIMKSMAIGASVYNDQLGPHDNFKFTGNYAYRIRKSSNNYLSFGLQVSYAYFRSDFSSLSEGVFQPNDPQLQGIVVEEGTPEFGAGIALVKPKFSLGFSSLNLVPKESVVTDSSSVALGRTNHFLYGSYNIKASPLLSIRPTFLVKYVTDLPTSFDAGVRFEYKEAIMAGLNYRQNESLAFALQLKINQQLSVGYAYDWLLGDVSALSNGSNELFVSYVFKFSENLSSPR